MAHVATPDGTHQESMCNWRQTNLPANWWDPGGWIIELKHLF